MIRWMAIIFLAVLLPAPCLAAAPAADPHQQLEQILRQPSFQAWRLREDRDVTQIDLHLSGRFTKWFQGEGRSIRDFIAWLFRSKPRSSVTRSGGASEALPTLLKGLAWAVVIVAVIAFGVLLIKTIARPTPETMLAGVLSREQVRDALEGGDALALESSQWLNEARRLAAEQDFRAVYRALYLALLSGLHTAGKIEHNRNCTNWTYVQHYRGPAKERDLFSELTQLFDRVWYGRLNSEGREIDELRSKVVLLTAGAPR